MKTLLLIIFSTFICSKTDASSVEPLYREYPTSRVRTNRIAVVVHGLNTKPERMLPIARFLNGLGSHVFNVALSGHRTGTDMKLVTANLWVHELENVLKSAKRMAQRLDVPLVLVGYSLGALVGLRSLQSLPAKYIDQAVLLAPAISLTRKTYLMMGLFLFDNLVVPSFSPNFYRANWGTSVASYKSLFKLNFDLFKFSWNNLHFPAIVFVDPRDELVSLQDMKSITPHSWEILPVDNSKGEAHTYHHLILDEYVLGKDEWKKMTSAIANFLHSSLVKTEALCYVYSCQ